MAKMYRLVRSEPRRNGKDECGGSWSLRVDCKPAEGATGVDTNIFVFHAVSDVDDEANDTYSHVASLAQMSDIPVGAPDGVPEGEEDLRGTADYIPFYRMPSVELSFPNAVMMEYTWKVMQRCVAQLVAEYAAFGKMEETEEVEL